MWFGPWFSFICAIQNEKKLWLEIRYTDLPALHGVLVLLPVLGSALQAKFYGPYEIESKLSETDYVIQTPYRKKKICECDINMLTKYDCELGSFFPTAPVASVVVTTPSYDPRDDGLDDKCGSS